MIHYLWTPRLLDGQPQPPGLGDLLPPPPAGNSEWREVDAAFREVAASVAPALFVAVTDEPAEEAARRVYVTFEPFGETHGFRGVVLAVDIAGKGVSIGADEDLWPAYGETFRRIMEHAERRLHAGRLFDALIFGMRGLQTALAPASSS